VTRKSIMIRGPAGELRNHFGTMKKSLDKALAYTPIPFARDLSNANLVFLGVLNYA
jgi:hypothetical protein